VLWYFGALAAEGSGLRVQDVVRSEVLPVRARRVSGPRYFGSEILISGRSS
jgi:hypothetical protein